MTKPMILLMVVLAINVQDIPGQKGKSLYSNASAIVRNYEETFEVKSPSRAKKKVSYEITILNESGEKYGIFYQFYDDFRKVRIKDAAIYNILGEKIKNIRSNDFEDQSMFSGYSIFEDNRVIYYQPQIKTYPYTVSYEYTIDYSGLINYPSWIPHMDYNIAVNNASFTFITRHDVGFHYDSKKINTEPEIIKDISNITYKWKVHDLEPIQKEPLSPGVGKTFPLVNLAPVKFEIDGYEGRLDSWNHFGQWVNELLNEQQNLPLATQKEMIELTDTLKTNRQKIEKIYEYLQKNTRYVSIQMGIGGWQPFDAETVDNLGYGDCKALANYTKALLEALGIESWYTVIKNSKNPFQFEKNFQSNQFNHAVICVPNEGDTIWLETTSKRYPAGYMGRSGSNRAALAITPEGGKLVNTPHYTANDNRQIQKAEFSIDEEGNALCKTETYYEGLQFDFFLNQEDQNLEEREKWLYKNLDMKDFNIKSFHYERLDDTLPAGKRSLILEINDYAQKSGSRLFIPLNQLNKRTYIPNRLENRQSEVLVRLSYHDTDTISMEIPDGYKIEYMPNPQQYESVMGQYSMEVTKEGNKIIYIRDIAIHKGIYDKDQYEDIRAFYKNTAEADDSKLILVKE